MVIARKDHFQKLLSVQQMAGFVIKVTGPNNRKGGDPPTECWPPENYSAHSWSISIGSSSHEFTS